MNIKTKFEDIQKTIQLIQGDVLQSPINEETQKEIIKMCFLLKKNLELLEDIATKEQFLNLFN